MGMMPNHRNAVHRLGSFKRRFTDSRRFNLAVVCLLAVVLAIAGYIALHLRAAGNTWIGDAESTFVIAKPATVVTDGSASLGKAIMFGSPPGGYVPPPEIARDCSMNVSYLNIMGAWLASLPDNAVVNFPPDACYLDQTQVQFANVNGLTIHGNGAQFKRTDNPSAPGAAVKMLLIQTSNNIKIDGLIFHDAKPLCTGYTRDSAHAIHLDRDNNVELYNNQIWDTWSDNLYVSGNGSHFRIHDNEFHQSGRQGIAFTGGSDIRIENNIVANSHRYSIDFEILGSTPASNVTIINNKLLGPTLGYLNVSEGPNLHGLTISNNTLSPNSPYPNCSRP